MIRSTFAHVDLAALAGNFRAIRDFVSRRRPARAVGSAGGSESTLAAAVDADPTAPTVVAVVKANAYGHGAAPVARALEQAGASMVACADVEEAIALREGGVGCRILVFGALSLSDLDGLFDYDLTPSISTPMAGREVQRAAERRARRVRYHLKIDTGMNRLGFRHDNLGRTIPDLLAAPSLDLEAVYTHFATADEPGHPLFEAQQRHFEEASRRLAALGVGRHLRHAANSAALLAAPSVWFDLVRPGLLLYGVAPPAFEGRIALAPVMSLRSRVVAVKGVRPGETIGYGAQFRALRPTTMAVVPAGYADGLDARLAGRGSVLVRGRRAPIVGSVCMDMIMVDVTGLEVQPGDEAVLVGRQGEESIGIGDMAQAIGATPYELLCRVGARIERVYNRAGA